NSCSMNILNNSLCHNLQQAPTSSLTLLLNLVQPSHVLKQSYLGRPGKVIDVLPKRETWFCLYQPQPARTAYLYEYDTPIDNDVYKNKVAPELRQRFFRPARDCYLHVSHGESFANCDVTRSPWYCYRVELSGVRIGQRLGPYAADDIVAPNRVMLPLQERWRNNVRDIRDMVEFLAIPPEARLSAALRQLVAVAHQDGWRSGPAVIHLLMAQRWGHEALRMHGITAAMVRQAYELHGDRMRQDGSSDKAAVAAALARRAARRRRRSTAFADGVEAAGGLGGQEVASSAGKLGMTGAGLGIASAVAASPVAIRGAEAGD
ncbi:hypothetical protein VaNZ11_008436, partial [Volvox africanus]